jgi:carnitine O-acetyltransferase
VAVQRPRFAALQKAINVHKAYVKDAMMGKGVDRHMLGLQIVAAGMEIKPRPAIFTDKGFLLSKKYVLSTSNVSMGASPMFGGFSPMVRLGSAAEPAVHGGLRRVLRHHQRQD